MKTLATEMASSTGGRDGRAKSADGKIDVAISPPGSKGAGTNPEQLFAAGYAACFGGALGVAARQANVPIRGQDIRVTATVELRQDDGGFFLAVTMDGELAGVEQAQAEKLMAAAHAICPYSKATRGNIEVGLRANGKGI